MSPTPTPASGACELSNVLKSLFQMSSFTFEATREAGVVTDTCIIPVSVGLARWGDFITGWRFPAPAPKICFWWDRRFEDSGAVPPLHGGALGQTLC